MDQESLRAAILSGISLPAIPARTVFAPEEGIRPDTGENLRVPIQRAIDRLSALGGGRLVFPAGTYDTGALHLKSGVELRLDSPDTLIRFANTRIEENYPVVFSHWEASPCYNFSALLYACGVHDIAVTGSGTLDGGADRDHWWDWHHQVEQSWSADKPDLQQPDRAALRQMNLGGVPVEERRFGPGHFLRPNFVQFLKCERVLLRGITLHNSPMWQLNPVLCKSVVVDGVTVSSHGSNNDGCDPESCDGVWIKNCRFDTGDDCISLKSGRDRDGQLAKVPCQNILIEDNDFADGHGGIALGSEMSGGIRRVLARRNRFSSPNLTYALRFKTNARRGGFVEEVMMLDSVMDHVHGAAVHGTMLYEDGRNGGSLPVFRDITVENIEAHGGDYGIFLEAFPEVPITGLTLRGIRIDGARRALRSMNWQGAVVEDVTINGKSFPRPGYVRILGVPAPGVTVRAGAAGCGGNVRLAYRWEISPDAMCWSPAGEGERFAVPGGAAFLRLTAVDEHANAEHSCPYQVLGTAEDGPAARLRCRGMLVDGTPDPDALATRGLLAKLLVPLADPDLTGPVPADTDSFPARLAAANSFFPLEDGCFLPEQTVTRQEMATVAMEACGVSYRNASSTMPVCGDSAEVSNNYGTNVARALYFGFMELEDGCFHPRRPVTVGEGIAILDRVADFAGL